LPGGEESGLIGMASIGEIIKKFSGHKDEKVVKVGRDIHDDYILSAWH
jgi:hypothetical protein